MTEELPPPSKPATSKDKDDIEFLLKVIGRYDTYIGTTNTKAAGIVALCAFLVGSSLLRWNDLVAGPKLQQALIGFCLVVSTLTALISIFHAMRAVFPQTKSLERPQEYSSLIAYTAVAKHTPDSYYKAIMTQVENARVRDCAFQAHTLATITNDKFAKLKTSFSCLLYGVLSFTALALILRLLPAAYRMLELNTHGGG